MSPISADSEVYSQFRAHLDYLKEVILKYRREVRGLKDENRRLRRRLEEIRKGQSDIYSQMADSERLKMRQHIDNIIERIDEHLAK